VHRVGGQLGRPFQEGRGRREPTARVGAVGRSFELGGDDLVRFRRRLRAVPRPAVGIEFGDRGQRAVSFPEIADVGIPPCG
jgi:hypothetical protein